MEQRECPVCREQFTPRSANQRFCCKQHSKAYQNAKKRGTLDSLLARGAVGVPFDCAECGAHCVPGEGEIDSRATKFCDRSCKAQWHRGSDVSRRWYERRLKEERAETRRRQALKALASPQVVGPPRKWINGRCKTCGASFTAPACASWAGHYCSPLCNRRHARAERRARKRNAWVEEVRRPKVYARDLWICQLCGDPVDPSAKYPNVMCASLDHIVPLAKGGEHSYENTQLAHALCNSLKGDRESGSMMFAA